ncbi:MAG TPA: PDZ domain-containing protein [Candidatus Didemnitutus sp.]|nr:PDZ domain-containing protein [Candidatus Didemnitutus sp.]
MKSACTVLLWLVLVGSLSAAEKMPAEPEEKIVTLDSYDVRGRPVSSFPITIQVQYNPELKKTKLVIIYVTPESDADRQGLRAGDEIVKIGGKPVEDMDPRVTKDSPIGKIFLNRKPGDRLDLEVVTHRTKAITLRASPAIPPPN